MLVLPKVRAGFASEVVWTREQQRALEAALAREQSPATIAALDQARAEQRIAVASLVAAQNQLTSDQVRFALEKQRLSAFAPVPPGFEYPAAPVTPSAWPLRLFLLWVFGRVLVPVAFAVGVLRTHLVACAAQPARGDALSDEVEVLSAELGIVPDVRVVTWPGPAMPMTWGSL